jgi:very-short-patch-repair endonuclease
MTITQLARQTARQLRKNPTKAEELLWLKLRKRQFFGLKFLRQHPVFYKQDNKKNFFVADFYNHEIRLVIEVDGEVHLKQKDYDRFRTRTMMDKELTVVRFSNDAILSNVDKVLSILRNKIDELELLTHPHTPSFIQKGRGYW